MHTRTTPTALTQIDGAQWVSNVRGVRAAGARARFSSKRRWKRSAAESFCPSSSRLKDAVAIIIAGSAFTSSTHGSLVFVLRPRTSYGTGRYGALFHGGAPLSPLQPRSWFFTSVAAK